MQKTLDLRRECKYIIPCATFKEYAYSKMYVFRLIGYGLGGLPRRVDETKQAIKMFLPRVFIISRWKIKKKISEQNLKACCSCFRAYIIIKPLLYPFSCFVKNTIEVLCEICRIWRQCFALLPRLTYWSTNNICA
jgi:hypothetical protein